jgi:hypothetical protein
LTQFISSSALKHDSSQSDLWLESGGLTIGPIDAEAAMALPNPDFHKIQDNFLKIHDKKTKRLWFVWPPGEVRDKSDWLLSCLRADDEMNCVKEMCSTLAVIPALVFVPCKLQVDSLIGRSCNAILIIF